MNLKVLQLLQKDLWKDVVRIPYVHRQDKDGNRIPSGSVCRIAANGKSRRVAIRGCKGKDAIIQIEVNLRNYLKLKVGQEYNFELTRTTFWGRWIWAWMASDPAYSVPAQIGLLALILGLIGLLLGGIGAWPVLRDWIRSK